MSVVKWLAVGLAAVAGFAAAAHADEACPVRPFRWSEDCSSLNGAALDGIDRFRFIPLDDDRSVWLTLGGEYRFKAEGLDAPDFAIRPADRAYTALGERFYLHADLRSSEGLRLFVQFSAATDEGRQPFERPFDRSSIDLAQGFVDVALPLFDSTVVRAGRQELDSEGNRLIATRDAANLRRAFDMVHWESTFDGIRGVAFYGRPVINRIDAFDDGADYHELFYGGWLEDKWGEAPLDPRLSLFFLARDRRLAIYEDGVAADHRRTIGLRATGSDPTFDYAFQGADQFGSFGGETIAAWGFAGDLGWHPDLWAHPRFGASFGYASGDSRPGDKTLGTFDVLYPNLGYFTDAPVYYPGNTADIQPNATFNVWNGLSVRGGSDFIWRISKFDAVYEPPGVPLVRGNGTGPSFVAALAYLRADWPINAFVSLAVSGVHGFTSAAITDARGRDFNYGETSLDLHF